MNSPFPGMDPYLEQPALWPDVHNSLALAIRDELVPRVAPRYYVALEERVYAFRTDDLALIGLPDVALTRRPDVEANVDAESPIGSGHAPSPNGVSVVEVEVPMTEETRQTYLEIRTVEGGTLVTVLELLSPANKVHPKGRMLYERKRRHILDSNVHLVEIDFHRAGEPMPLAHLAPASDYRILISRSQRRPKAQVYGFSARDPIPTIPIPLRAGDAEPDLELNRVVHEMYKRARFDLRLDYTKPPTPPLSESDAACARERIEAARRNEG